MGESQTMMVSDRSQAHSCTSMNKWIVNWDIYTDKGISFILRKEENSNTHYKMDDKYWYFVKIGTL